jgi:hypothetical protein
VRFLVQPTPESLVRARPPVRAFLLFAALALAAIVAQRAMQGGLLPAGVEARYLGDGEPMPAAAIWEEVHAGAFVYGLLLFMLGSLLAVSPVGPRTRAALLAAGTAAALADLVAPFAIVAAAGAGALRVGTFVAVVAALGAQLGLAAVRFGRPGRRADA